MKIRVIYSRETMQRRLELREAESNLLDYREAGAQIQPRESEKLRWLMDHGYSAADAADQVQQETT